MKKRNLFLCALILFAFAGCKDPNEPEELIIEDSKINSYDKYDAPIIAAEIIKEVSEDGFRKIIFDYPSTDVKNNPVRVSGIICMDLDFYNSAEKHADYTILVNHGATPKWDDCPSRNGGKELCGYLTGINASDKNVIGIAPDYLGLGSSKNQMQAFVFGEVNARASLDALYWGRKLLKEKSFTWEDEVANIGYSQGGQTAICVQKLVDADEYPDITITKTFAGDGVYNIRTMVEESLNNNTPLLPSVVFLGIVTYNRLEQLNFDESEIFKDPDLIEEYIMSKKYDLKGSILGLITALNRKNGTAISLNNYNDWTHYLTENMLDKESTLYKAILAAIEPYTNYWYWTPKSTTKIVLFTADNDDIVPSKNSDNLFNYLKSNSTSWADAEAITDIDTDFSADNIYIRYHEDGESSLTNIIHEKGAKTFSSKVIEELKTNW